MLIGELSSQSGVSPRSLRYYEKLDLLAATRTANGYRQYAEDAVTVVRTIKSMFDLGFSSAMVRTVLPCATGTHEGVDRRRISGEVALLKDDIAGRIEQLSETHRILVAFLASDMS